MSRAVITLLRSIVLRLLARRLILPVLPLSLLWNATVLTRLALLVVSATARRILLCACLLTGLKLLAFKLALLRLLRFALFPTPVSPVSIFWGIFLSLVLSLGLVDVMAIVAVGVRVRARLVALLFV